MATIRPSLPDPVTSLPGRQDFFRELHDTISRCHQGNELLAVILVDLKNFRQVNSTYGYATGNRVLSDAGARIQALARKSDSVMRIGNDEFALVLPGIRNRNIPVLAANRIIQSLQEPFHLSGVSVRLKANLGIAIFPEHAGDGDALILQAEEALMQARNLQEPYVIACSQEESSSHPAQILESELDDALAEGDLELYYQPKVNLRTGRLAGAEALLRWNHPEKGFISPGLFIPVAENSEIKRPLTLWCINTALRQACDIRSRWKGFSVSVNIPANLLHEPYLIELVERALATWDTRAEHLMLEITESAIMSDPDLSLRTLKRFHDLGVGLSLDDFGTGYSSFSYLKRIPIDELKIDREFIVNMQQKKVDARIVESIIHMAHNLRLKVIAEGVEDAGTMALLEASECDLIQGYYIAKPLPFSKFLDWLEQSDWGLGGIAKEAGVHVRRRGLVKGET